jgi:hypothetical protein
VNSDMNRNIVFGAAGSEVMRWEKMTFYGPNKIGLTVPV